MDTEDISRRVIEAVARHPDGIGLAGLEAGLDAPVSRRGLQYRLKALVAEGRLTRRGERRWARYFVGSAGTDSSRAGDEEAESRTVSVRLSPEGEAVLRRIDRPVATRDPASWRPEFSRTYRASATGWLSPVELERLHDLGAVADDPQPAGTYARRIVDRLLIDLSWNSSRLEGNTYSLLDTRRLLALGVEAEGRSPVETQMIRNHREAIEFLVDNAADTGFDRRTVSNLHALLANELLPDPLSPGRLRRMPVGIGGST